VQHAVGVLGGGGGLETTLPDHSICLTLQELPQVCSDWQQPAVAHTRG
jgi:hypothetical protein